MERKIMYKTKDEAITASEELIKKINKLEKEYGLSFNSDSGDVYLSFRLEGKHWESVELGWIGDGSISVTETREIKENEKKDALAKLTEPTDEEKELLGLSDI